MEYTGFLSGVPLASVRYGRFINKLLTFFTLSKLIYNGAEYEFTGVGNGTVVMSLDALDWTFTAPSGRFDADTLAALSMGQLLETVASSAETNAIPAWDDFALWMAQDVMTGQINAVLSACSSASVNGVSIPIPTYSAPTSFASLLRWIKTVIGSAADLPAANFRSPQAANRFDVAVRLLQPDPDAAGEEQSEILLADMDFALIT